MKLYAVLNEKGKPIAYHENKRVAEEFLKVINKKDHVLVKVKHPKVVEETDEYMDLHLVKLGKHYVPAKYYDSADILEEEELYSYNSLVDIISRELEFNEMSRRERNALMRTLIYFKERLKELESNPYDYEYCKRFHEMREEYEYSIGVDDLKEDF